MTEPDAGSAVTDLKTSAVLDGDHYIVNGSKIFSTHSPEAELFLIYVRFGPGVGGIGSILMERGTPGFEVGTPSNFMNGEQWSQLYFDNCRVQIGRASCRERVCQVGVDLGGRRIIKKKKNE